MFNWIYDAQEMLVHALQRLSQGTRKKQLIIGLLHGLAAAVLFDIGSNPGMLLKLTGSGRGSETVLFGVGVILFIYCVGACAYNLARWYSAKEVPPTDEVIAAQAAHEAGLTKESDDPADLIRHIK